MGIPCSLLSPTLSGLVHSHHLTHSGSTLTEALQGALIPDSYSWKGTYNLLSPTPHLCGRRGYEGGPKTVRNLSKVTEQWGDRTMSLGSAGQCFFHHTRLPARSEGLGRRTHPAQRHVLWLTNSIAHQVKLGSRRRRTGTQIPAQPHTSHVSQNKKFLLSKNEFVIFKMGL